MRLTTTIAASLQLHKLDALTLPSSSSWTITFLNPVYTIQPVVKLVVQPVWQPAVSCKQTYNRFDKHGLTTILKEQQCSFNRLSIQLSNGFDNRLNVCIHDTTGCETGLTTGCIV